MIRSRELGKLLFPLALLLPGCSGVMWVNLSLLVVTVGIFFGTLTLGRRASARSAESRGGEVSRS